MRQKTTSVLGILLLIFSILLISCSRQKTGWKGTIEEIDGVTVVKNPIVCKKNRLYAIEEDEEGYQVVKRYKVTWKN